MSIIQVKHIESNCRSRFVTLIDTGDLHSLAAEDKDTNFLTRALAAFAIASAAKIDDTLAAASVVDEAKDDGIDAFYYDRVEHVCYLAQSKWSKNGNATIDVGSVLKFIQGINHFLEAKLNLLGPKLQAKKQEIQDVLAGRGGNPSIKDRFANQV